METEKIIDGLCLIDNVVVNYSQGRRRGLTDEETEDRALKAVSLAMERLEKTKTNKHKVRFEDLWDKGSDALYDTMWNTALRPTSQATGRVSSRTGASGSEIEISIWQWPRVKKRWPGAEGGCR